MEPAPPPHGRRLGQGATQKCPSPAYLAGHHPRRLPPRGLLAFGAVCVRFKAFSQPPPSLFFI